ncbi:oxygenase MpaB family protein [Gordonia humi]|uniref:Gas vesicle protein n=1 Tax=Gordonia humi TaxID=686429 RepID=A0A840EYH0_9ACTN|nr:oxygenase MpaB family protein [Gordonia humi]MBB4135374.1 gas vesicle protein [Gordonia humi]
MEDLSRRRVLRVGAGASAALLAAPTFGWTAARAGAAPGDGPRIDAKHTWDDEPDELIADIYSSGQVTKVNNAMRKWQKNGQGLSKEIPADLRTFIEKARELPDWADAGKLDDAVRFNQKRGTYLGALYGFASGMMSAVIPHEAMVVYYSRGGAQLKDRIAKTAKLGYDIGSLNAYQDGGEMAVTCVKTRLIHSAVRHLLPQQHKWSSRMPYQEKPITQADQMVTWHSLPTTVMRMLRRWQVPVDARESEGFLHSWQVAGHMLGIRDGLIPATWKDAEDQSKVALDPILKGTPEGRKLAHMLLQLGFNLDLSILSPGVLGALTRFMLGDRIATELRIPREPVWDPLLAASWGPFVLVREGLLDVGMPKEVYWTFDEMLRQFVLLYISELRMPINIELPYTNNPEYK